MLPSAIDSDEYFLQLLWNISLWLIGISVCALCVLISARFLSEHRKAGWRSTYKTLSGYFYAVLSAPGELSADAFPKVSHKDKDIIIDISLDILRTLKGRDTQRIVSLLKLWGMAPYLSARLQKGTRGEKIRALSLLSYFDTDEAHALLQAYAESPDIYVQLAALRGLAWQKRLNDIDRIVTALSRSKGANRLMLADILRRFGEPIVPALIDLAGNSADDQVCLAAIMAIGYIKPLSAITALLDLTHNENADIRQQAALALGRIGDIRAGQALVALLGDVAATVRASAAQALGMIGFDDALSVLGQILSDNDWQTRFRAAESLHRMGPKGIAALKSFSQREDNAGVIASQVLAEKESYA